MKHSDADVFGGVAGRLLHLLKRSNGLEGLVPPNVSNVSSSDDIYNIVFGNGAGRYVNGFLEGDGACMVIMGATGARCDMGGTGGRGALGGGAWFFLNSFLGLKRRR